MTEEQLFAAIGIAAVVFFLWKYYRYGSFTGAMLNGRIKKTVGEITLSSGPMYTSVLKVHTLDTPPGTAPTIALVLISKALPFAASMTPITLSSGQTEQLRDLLHKAGA